ncbi:tetratricopeptide repeat protein [Lacunimicrobium album]
MKQPTQSTPAHTNLSQPSDGPHFMPAIHFNSHTPVDAHPAPSAPIPTAPLPQKQAPPNADVDRGLALQKQGKIDDAERLYRKVLKQDPTHGDALHLLGLVHYAKQQHTDAERLVRKALDSVPNQPIYLNSLGSILRDANKLDDASQALSKLITIDDHHVLGLVNLAKVYRLQNKLSDAVLLLKKALALEPNNPDVLEEYAHDLCQLQDYKTSADLYARFLTIKRDHINGLHLRGCCLYYMKQYEEAIQLFEKVIAKLPSFATCYSNKGACHQAIAEFKEARACYEKALSLEDTIPDAHNNLANVLQMFGDVEGSERHYRRAIQLDASYYEPQYSLGETRLMHGDFIQGWEGYAKRVLKREHDHRPFDHPVWDGQRLAHERLLIFSEQGIGDVIMFGSCLADVMKLSPQTTLETDARTVAMFERSFPGLKAIPRSKTTPVGVKIKLPDIDVARSMGDLPQMFRPSIASHPGVAYLRPDPQLIAAWKPRFEALGTGLKVGISWRGGKNKEVGTKRSLPLEQWKPIFQTPGVHFVNLQYGDCTAEKQLIQREFGVTLHDFPESNPLENLELFAAQMSLCDLVISIDNATVHFAGALGVPCWTMLSKVPEWRWLLKGDRSYWYKSLKLFRQSKAFEWSPVVSDIARELRSTANNPMLLQDFNHRLQEPVTPSAPSVRLAPRLAVITPVGPGHAQIYEENLDSVKRACTDFPGPFSKVMPLRLNDLQGNAGRSYARNFGLKQALEAGCEWVFFLDADDVLVPNAFDSVAPYLNDYDAIWGQIYSFQHGTDVAEARADQLGQTDRYEDILQTDPFLTLQMGHFVRTEIALKTLFHEGLDAGEDFHYYLRLWEQYRCIKIDQPFFANRRGMHSTGPRAATGRDWMTIVSDLMQQARTRYQARKLNQPIPDWNIISKTSSARSFSPGEKVAESSRSDEGSLRISLQPSTPLLSTLSIENSQHLAHHTAQDMLAQSRKHGTTADKPHADHTKFWESDNFQNIIPQNASLGEFPEGWNVRELLSTLFTPYADHAHATGQGDGTILEVGCGYGRLASAFPPSRYRGVDVNINAIQRCQSSLPLHQFTKVDFIDEYPRSSLAFTYCVLLHIDDEAVKSVTAKLCQAAPVVVIAEIMGRKWRRGGLPPVYNREESEYEALMQAQGYRLFRSCRLPYLHYQNTNISLLFFRPERP